MTARLATGSYRFNVERAYAPASEAGERLKQLWEQPVVITDAPARNWLPLARATLDSIAREASEDGWDGEGSRAVSNSTLRVAERVAQALFTQLPLGTPAPDLVADSDGEISFDWIIERGRIFSLSVSAPGRVSYAARFGDSGSTRGWQQLDLSSQSALAESVSVIVDAIVRFVEHATSGHSRI